jgi:uncharacterized protein YmfQ (DUF2313 family)
MQTKLALQDFFAAPSLIASTKPDASAPLVKNWERLAKAVPR